MEKKFSIEKNGKIYGKTDSLKCAICFARELGKNAIVFANRVIVYQQENTVLS